MITRLSTISNRLVITFETKFRIFRRRWFEFFEGMGIPYDPDLSLNWDQVKSYVDSDPTCAIFRVGEKHSGKFTNSNRLRYTSTFCFTSSGMEARISIRKTSSFGRSIRFRLRKICQNMTHLKSGEADSPAVSQSECCKICCLQIPALVAYKSICI